MNDEQIFQLAEKCGFQDDYGRWNFNNDGLLDFVFLVQNAEREACAKVVEADGLARGNEGLVLIKAASRIRARGEK
jgi:hypothetical protein